MHAPLKYFVSEDCGQGLIEYALILSLIALVAIIGLKTFGTAVANSLTTSNTKLP